MNDLLRSHRELRIAGKRIPYLNRGRKNDAVLRLLRQKLREAREVAKAYRREPSRASSPPRSG